MCWFEICEMCSIWELLREDLKNLYSDWKSARYGNFFHTSAWFHSAGNFGKNVCVCSNFARSARYGNYYERTEICLLPHNNSHIEQNSLLDTNLSLWEVWQRIYLITLVYEVYTGSSQSTHPSRKSSVWELLQHLLCRKFGNEFSSQHRGSLLGLGEKALYWNFGNEFRPSSLWEVLLRI